MAEKKKDGSELTMYPKSEYPTPAQLRAAGAQEIPKGKQAAKDAIMRLTQDFKNVFYWVPKPPAWLEKHLFGQQLPHGRRVSDRALVPVRQWDECALVVHDPKLWEQGCVKLRYEDKVEIVICVEELHFGIKFSANQVRKKLVPVRAGEQDVQGLLHKRC